MYDNKISKIEWSADVGMHIIKNIKIGHHTTASKSEALFHEWKFWDIMLIPNENASIIRLTCHTELFTGEEDIAPFI